MNIYDLLTSKDDSYSCTKAKEIIIDSDSSNIWFKYIDDFVCLLSHPKSLVRNRAINILASLVKWDNNNYYDKIIDQILVHVNDEKPITSRQCIKAVKFIGLEKRQYINKILEKINSINLSMYKDSMRPLIEKDIEETINLLSNIDI